MVEETEASGQTPASDSQADPDAGAKKALQAERKARQAAEKAAREAGDRLSELESANIRRDVATGKGLTEEQAKFLTGSTAEEMEASADAMLAAFAPAGKKNAGRVPKEQLRSGASGGDDEPPDASKVADRILDRGF